MPRKIYGLEFYNQRRQATLPAARRILGILAEQWQWTSAVDFGCGTGTWLSVAREFGAQRVRGYEGAWLKQEWQDDPAMDIRRVNLDRSIDDIGQYDLAISLEVAEHLRAERAASFVAQLCSAAPLVLFSAAIPGQGGDGHIHERWQDYWAGLFELHGYSTHDCIRRQIWDDTSIPYWYRQNCLAFVRGSWAQSSEPLNLVHPEQFLELQNRRENPSLQDLARGLHRWIRRILASRP